MKELTQAVLKECFDYDPDTGVLIWKKRPLSHFKNTHGMRIFNSRFAGKATGYRDHHGYLVVQLGGECYQAHRIIWALQNGVWPSDVIDHIDGSPSNNRFANLRAVSHRENLLNQKTRKNNTSGFLGVSWSRARKKWEACIQVDGRTKHLGFFADKADAIAARKAASIECGFHPNHGRADA